jgi:predicted permease
MNNDHVLAGQIVVWTTMVSGITIFLFIFVFKSLGYL